MVVDVDVQRAELKQAAHAFVEQRNLYFMCGDILVDIFKQQSIDIIILAASVRHMKDFSALVLKLLLAKQRSERHLVLMGTPEMCDKYFHHSFQQREHFNYQRSFSTLLR